MGSRAEAKARKDAVSGRERSRRAIAAPGRLALHGPLWLVFGALVLAAVLLTAFAPFAGGATAAPSAPALQQYAGFVEDAWESTAPSWNEARSIAHPLLPGPRLSLQSTTSLAAATPTRYQQTDAHLLYSGTWSTFSASSASGGSYKRTSWMSSSVTVYFYGTSLAWIATKGTTSGRAQISLDYGSLVTVDLYAEATAYQVNVWSTGTLPLGVHRVQIYRDHTNADGKYINVDAFDVVGTLVDESATEPGSISGRVTGPTGTGLANIEVDVFSDSWDSGYYVFTDASGYYAFEGLPRDVVYVCTYNEYPLNYIDEWYNNIPVPGHWDGSGATPLDLDSDNTRTGINFQLAVGKMISGTVSTASGPLPYVVVFAVGLDDLPYAAAVTGPDGAYHLTGLPAGQYRVVTSNGDGYVDEWYNNDPVSLDPDGASATLVDVRTANATGKNFVLDLGRTIAGRVTAVSGTPLEDVEIRVQPAVGEYEISTLTDDTGWYEIVGLLPGEYAVNTANDQGYVDEWYDNVVAPGDLWGTGATPVDVSTDDAYGTDFALERGHTISGTVTWTIGGTGLSEPMVVEITDRSGALFALSLVGAEDGSAYTTWALPAGTYYAKTTDFLISSFAEEWYDDLPCSQYDLASATPIHVIDADITGIGFGLDTLNYYEQTDGHIVYGGSWSNYTSASSSGGSYGRATGSTASATVYFTGISLDWVAMMGTTTGKADVYVDDVLTDTIDLAAPVATYQELVWTSGDLPRGQHKVQIVWNASNAAGKYITLDALRVDGTLTYAPPKITSMTPASGLVAGGNSVVITGQNFTGASAVAFGETGATSFVVDSATQITAVAPAHAEGTVRVRVTTPTGITADSAADDYTYRLPVTPTITSLSPASGSTAGGTSVIISGTGFDMVSAVLFGESPATSYVVNSSATITAVAPAHAEGPVRVRVAAAGGNTEDTASDDFTYTTAPPVTRYEQTNTNIVENGAWADFSTTSASGGGYGRSATSGASATIYFAGTRLDWIAMKGTTTGIADVYLDGVKKATINLAASAATYQVNVWSTGTISDGSHTVKIVRSSSSGTGKYLTLDAVDIWGTITGPPSPGTRYEQTNTNIVENGAWADFSTSSASGGSYGRSATSGASATIYFTGTRLDWIAMKGTTTGIADVYLDGEWKATIDLSAAAATYKVNVWSTGTLANGRHDVRIVRNPASASGKYVTLDAVDIWGTIGTGP